MKNLLLLLLFIPLVSFGQDAGGFIITNNNPENKQDLGYDIMDTFVLKNGNTLTLASVDRDYRTANSECQCEEYQFGKVFWIFEKDIDNKIINQRCYKKDDLVNISNEYTVRSFMDNLWFNCAPHITKIFYVGDDVVFHFLAGARTRDPFLDTYTSTSGSSLLVKFNLSNFQFYEPKPFHMYRTGTSFMNIDKLFYINDSHPVSLYKTLSVNNPQGNYANLITSGYQDLVFGNLGGSDYRLQYTGKQLIKEIFDGNSDEMILDYKQDSKNSLTFLVASNSLDGLYLEGEDFKTSLYIIKATYTTSNSSNPNDKDVKVAVNYSVTKSKLQIPRNIDLHFQEYNVFVDNNNSFVINIKDDEVEGTVGYSGDTDIYNKLYFLNDDGSFKSINIDNDFGLEFVDNCSVDRKYAIAYSGAADKSIYNNTRNLTTSGFGKYVGHHLIDIAFSDNIFMTLESNSLKYQDGNSGWKNYSIVLVLKTFDYNGNLLSRNVVFVSNINKNGDGVLCLNPNDGNSTTFHYLANNSSNSNFNFIDIDFLKNDTVLIDNFDSAVWCGDGLNTANQSVYKFKHIPNSQPEVTSQDVTANEQTAVTITLAGTDADGDTLTYSIVDAPTSGTATLDGVNVTYTSTSDTATSDSFTYKANDGEIDSAAATVSITISPVNDAPVATDQSVTTVEDIPLEITMSGTDPESDVLTYAIVTNSSNGSVTLVDNKATYVPIEGFFGSDSFTFKVNDGTVDSPVAATVSITVTSNDTDGDGVLNDVDECPNTPAGSVVNFKGCIVFSLPANNNKVQVTSASCIGTDDGSIALSVEDSSNDYTITVTGQSSVSISGTNKTVTVTGLAKGTYQVCFKVVGQSTYEQCFEAVIGEPAALSAFVDVNNDDKTTSISLGGSNTYNIEINGVLQQVKGNSFDTKLPTGLNRIRISTDLACQGIIEKDIFISEDILYYPNPTRKEVKVHVSGKDTKVMVSVFSEKGDLIYSKEQEIQDKSRLTDIDLSRQITGTYIVVMEGKTVRKTFKIVKR